MFVYAHSVIVQLFWLLWSLSLRIDPSFLDSRLFT